MIYVTGDLHGDILRLKGKSAKKLKRNDYLIVCGDFGFIWNDSKSERKLLKWIGRRRFHTLFVEGTHDNLDLLSAYPVADWNGGKVHEISGKLRHLIRGGVFTIDDQRIFAFGGGESTDMDMRLKDELWWGSELPCIEEMETAAKNLVRHNNLVDYIITHESSRKIKRFLTMEENEANILDTFLDKVRENCAFKRWFFGRYHINKMIPPSEIALFNAIIPINADKI